MSSRRPSRPSDSEPSSPSPRSQTTLPLTDFQPIIAVKKKSSAIKSSIRTGKSLKRGASFHPTFTRDTR